MFSKASIEAEANFWGCSFSNEDACIHFACTRRESRSRFRSRPHHPHNSAIRTELHLCLLRSRKFNVAGRPHSYLDTSAGHLWTQPRQTTQHGHHLRAHISGHTQPGFACTRESARPPARAERQDLGAPCRHRGTLHPSQALRRRT